MSSLARRFALRPLSVVPPIVACIILASAAALLILPPPGDMPVPAARAAGLVVFAVGFWALGVIPEIVTALSFYLIAMLFEVQPPQVVFSSFASTAMWMVFGGLFIGVAVQRTGLGQKLANAVLARTGNSYLAVLTGIALSCILLSFLMPSVMGRVLLLIPVTVALSDSLGYTPGSRGRAGIVMTTLLTTYMPSCAILPSNIPNMVLIGAAQTHYGVTLTYGHYLLTHFPVLGIVKTVVIVGLGWALFREAPAGTPAPPEEMPMTRDARRLLVILLVALAFWMTDFLHHISPAWVALAVAIYLLLPRVGLLPVRIFNDGMNFAPFFLASAVLAVGAVVAASGLGKMLAELLISSLVLSPGADFASYMSLSFGWTLLGVVFTVAGLPAIVTPLAADMANAAGWPLDTVLATEVIGYSTVLLPYQMGPLMVGLALGGVTVGDGARIMLPLAALTFLIVLPLNFLWWSWLGYFGG